MHDKKPKKKGASEILKMIMEAAGKGDVESVEVHEIKGEGDLMQHLHDHIDEMHGKVDLMTKMVTGMSMQMGSIIETQKETRDSMNELFKLFMKYADMKEGKTIKKAKTE